MSELTDKLHPARFPGMSPLMSAIVGYILRQSFTNPEIAEILVSESENIVYIRQSGSPKFDGLLSMADLRRNWNALMDAAGLSTGERAEAVRLFTDRIRIVPGTTIA
jgi:hypothetical protein